MKNRLIACVSATVLASGLTLVATSPAYAAGITTVTELKTAFATGGTVTLDADLTMTDETLEVGTAPVTLDLNGHSLTVNNTTPGSGAAIGVPAGRSLTIEDTSAAGTGLLTATAQWGAGIGAGSTTPADAGSITITSGTVDAESTTYGAGIGGGNSDLGSANGGTVLIEGGTVTAKGSGGAGIGGGINNGAYPADGGSVTITGGTVTAIGEAGAGIGGGNSQGSASGGTVTISGGTVTATSTYFGAGIGGGTSAGSSDGGTIAISGGTVTAGSASGAGIGGGTSTSDTTDGGTVTITAGTVTATSSQAAGIGGGLAALGGTGDANGADLTIGSAAIVTTSGSTTAIGGGSSPSAGFGALSNAGTLTLGSDTAIPAGTTVTNTGTIVNEATLTVAGTLESTGSGKTTNQGVIETVGSGAVAGTVTGNNYLISYDPAGGTPTPADQQLYAASFDAAGLSLAAAPTLAGNDFKGWLSGSTTVTGSTELSTLAGTSTGSTVEIALTASWQPVLAATGATFPAIPIAIFALLALLTGAGLLLVRRPTTATD